jgi:serine/threonine protein kinase
MISSGTKLGRYEIRSKVGEGGMGEVYAGRDTQLGRDVAVKICSPLFLDRKCHNVHRSELAVTVPIDVVSSSSNLRLTSGAPLVTWAISCRSVPA